MVEVISFKVVDEYGNGYEATCVFSKEPDTTLQDGTRMAGQERLPKCKLEDGRSIVPVEENVFQIVNTETRLYVKEG